MAEPTLFLDRLEDVVRHHGGNAAYSNGRDGLRYRKLSQRLIRLAGALEAADVGRRDVVALHLPRGPWFLVASLACWWRGAAFVPLDVAWPDSRKSAAIRAAAARCVVSTQVTPFTGEGIAVVDANSYFGFPSVPRQTFSADDLAYLIFTSGSTGTPKLVAVDHRGIVPVLDAQIAAFDFRPGDRVLWMLNPAFDASLSDVGTALLSGATILCADDAEVSDPVKLLDRLHRDAITHVDLPPSLLPHIDPNRLPATLRTVVVGGEAARPDVLRAWAKRVRVVNVYGPTEATICTSLGVVDAATWGEPLIGRPIAGMSYRVDDTGELLISGPGLARGYVDQPDLTSAKFPVIDNVRWYRTGDMVREREDGEYVFLGRKDRQVKWHGKLIEPQEVESALLACDGVTRAAVVIRPEAQVFVAFHQGGGDDLRDRLAATLPAWMLPRRVVRVAAWPTTSSGKTDYAALENLSPVEADGDGLLGLAARVLGVRRVSPQESFAAQGGDSLAALRLTAAASARGMVLSPAALVGEVPLGEVMARAATAGVMAADDLRKDAATILHPLSSRGARGERILLTGATGWFGRYLLRELLDRTDARITCLARNPAAIAPHPRVAVVRGDIGVPHFGLETESRFDVVIHSAARVHLLASYADLRRDNVEAVAHALSFHPRKFHHISTLSVFVATERNSGVALEADDLAATREVYGGYAQSKFAAEILARSAGATVHRPGLITAHSATGEVARGDFLVMFLRGLLQLGCLPRTDADALRIDITPVDFAAAACAEVIARGGTGTFHYAGDTPLSLARILDRLAAVGMPIRTVSNDEWADRLRHLPETPGPASAAVLALCRGLPDVRGFAVHRTMDLFQATGVRFDMSRTRAILGGTNISCPPLSDGYVGNLIRRATEAER